MKIFDGLHGFLWVSMSVNNCNSYFIEGSTRILLDPGHLHLFQHVESGLKQIGTTAGEVGLALATHAHPDHIEAVSLLKGPNTPFGIHEEDWQLFKDTGKHFGLSIEIESYVPDFFLTEGNLEVKGEMFEVIHTPGHSPGSVCLYWPAKKALFTGDLLFKNGLGRTDLPGGNGEILKESIKRLTDLDVEWMLPGHGEIIKGARQVRTNFEQIEHYWFAYI